MTTRTQTTVLCALGVDEKFVNVLANWLFTQGEMSQKMLSRATPVQIRRGSMKLIAPEDLIGLKLQALANNPERELDRADIRLLLRQFSSTMDVDLLRDYFRLFKKESEFDELLKAHKEGS